MRNPRKNTRTTRNLLLAVLLAIGLAGTVVLEGIVKPRLQAEEEQYRLKQQSPATHDYSAVLRYHSNYMGDSSNFINLNNRLPLAGVPKTFQLYPDRLAADVIYEIPSAELGEQLVRQAVLYNATAQFALIDNLQELRLLFPDGAWRVARADAEAWYGMELGSLRDVQRWRNTVQAKIVDDSFVDGFLAACAARTE
ncbi:hypothetical protein J31TS4_20930 [Paenibacillus sp. J31TS4]|uniref:DUF4825 domain-containing protein n=1 Tax=Paenibacillus sp. J31TS4 TaxID=2807195 RepID=UPI001B10472F|nr:DUF4825 domain-containing protein [Paenibacillus sp. J31TS4]GIP38813.1 hypothetical protein J31TS4_20930 [Paenibacillus sp. J31TS4]